MSDQVKNNSYMEDLLKRSPTGTIPGAVPLKLSEPAQYEEDKRLAMIEVEEMLKASSTPTFDDWDRE